MKRASWYQVEGEENAKLCPKHAAALRKEGYVLTFVSVADADNAECDDDACEGGC